MVLFLGSGAHPFVTRPHTGRVSTTSTGLGLTNNFQGWFKGLSNHFLTTRTARLLVLAGTDRLDRELMIGQMQGKFQMNVVPDVGHMLHEVRFMFWKLDLSNVFPYQDNPVALAEIHVEFWRRNERSPIVGIKKVGEE